MNSEKVKEIKKALECCSISCTDCPYDKGETTNPICINNLTKNALTLINELESENERLGLERDVLIGKKIVEKQKSDKALIMKIDIQEQLKDRIAELEKEKTEQLKQFAERLKEKCEYNRKQYCCSATVGANDIDETLKEFING